MASNEQLLLWWLSGIFVIYAVLISTYAIVRHLLHYTVPQHQKYIVRILLMVPVYAIDSWFSLRFYDVRVFVELARHCYEAYVLYCFFLLLVNYLEGEANIITMFGLFPFPFEKKKKKLLHLSSPLSPPSPSFHLLSHLY